MCVITTGFQARSRGRWSWTLSPEEIMSWRWSWAAKVGLLSLQAVRQQQCNGDCPCDCPSTAVETAIAQCTSRWAMARGQSLNTSIVLAAVHGLFGPFSGGIRGRAFTLSTPPPPPHPPTPPSPSLISHLASVDVKQYGHGQGCRLRVQELCESRGGRPGLSVLTSLLVSVDVKLY